MIPPLPAGSKISVQTDDIEPLISIPYQGGGIGRYSQGLFMLFWLCGWAFGFFNATSKILAGNGNAFLVFWLAIWTIGGAWAAYMTYRIFRPTIPEALRLKPTGVAYDSGVSPPQMNWGYGANRKDTWKSLMGPRKRLEFDRATLRSLRLRSTDTTNRLTIDMGATRIDLAKSASEIEREWLYGLIARKYSIPAEPRDPASNGSIIA